MEKQPPPPYEVSQGSHGFPNPGYGEQSYNYQPLPRTSLPAETVYGQPAHAPSAPTQAPVIMAAPPPVVQTTSVVHVSTAAKPGCPVCHNNSWTGTYSCCAWCLAIFCFPVGIIFCCCMRKKKCNKCGFIAQ